MSRSLSKSEFWVINVSDRNVSLSDLALSIPAGRAYNLLDDKHFHYTIEQLKASMETGSLYKKRNRIKIGNGPPQSRKLPKLTVSKYPIEIRPRSATTVEEPVFDELIVSDSDYAEELAREFDKES